MPREVHPLRLRAIEMMRDGLAYPEEIAVVLAVPKETVRSWRRRAGVWTKEARLRHVSRLLFMEME